MGLDMFLKGKKILLGKGEEIEIEKKFQEFSGYKPQEIVWLILVKGERK